MSASSASATKVWIITLWIAQILLAAMYAMVGFMKLTAPIAQLTVMMPWVGEFPPALPRFIGTMELLGAIGLILPAATRILPVLTPAAAIGLSLVQVLAIALHVSRGEFSVLPLNVVLIALSVYVAWGRLKKAPISPR